MIRRFLPHVDIVKCSVGDLRVLEPRVDAGMARNGYWRSVRARCS